MSRSVVILQHSIRLWISETDRSPRQQAVVENELVMFAVDGLAQNDQLRSKAGTDGTPDMDRAAAVGNRFQGAVRSETLVHLSLHPNLAFSWEEQEPSLVREGDAGPLGLAKMATSHCPTKASRSVTRRQLWLANWLSKDQAFLVQPVANRSCCHPLMPIS